MGVYLIHFNKKLRHAQHYIGYVKDDAGLDKRLTDHLCGMGPRIMEVLFERGIEWTPARIWFGADRKFERRLKLNWHGRRLCPICSGSAAMGRMNQYPNSQLKGNFR